MAIAGVRAAPPILLDATSPGGGRKGKLIWGKSGCRSMGGHARALRTLAFALAPLALQAGCFGPGWIHLDVFVDASGYFEQVLGSTREGRGNVTFVPVEKPSGHVEPLTGVRLGPRAVDEANFTFRWVRYVDSTYHTPAGNIWENHAQYDVQEHRLFGELDARRPATDAAPIVRALLDRILDASASEKDELVAAYVASHDASELVMSFTVERPLQVRLGPLLDGPDALQRVSFQCCGAGGSLLSHPRFRAEQGPSGHLELSLDVSHFASNKPRFGHAVTVTVADQVHVEAYWSGGDASNERQSREASLVVAEFGLPPLDLSSARFHPQRGSS